MAEPVLRTAGADGPVRDILVVELLGGIGDVLMVLPAVHALARRHPEATVRVLTYEPGASLLAADPEIDEVVAVPKAPGLARAAVEAELARRTPDLAVSTTTYDGIADLVGAGAPRAVTNLWRAPPPDELVDVRFLHLLAADGLIAPEARSLPTVRVTAAAVDRQAAALAALLPAPAVPPAAGCAPVLLVVDAGMAVKRWPARRWVALTRALVERGRPVIAVGGESPDRDAVRAAGALMAPDLPLVELAAFFAAAGRLGGTAVGGDTGPARLAAAVGLPVVALFGPTAATRYGLRGTVRNLQGLPACPVRRPTAITEQDCWWTGSCPLDSREPACMADLPVASVLAALTEIGG